ncbi:UBA/TS-N domain-containing protein [Phlyctema vagabunda]|uniref:UBA/TS-N domain-containing protein n=1 Tax=Phlyctema vagabunda TaxID=108571 RepID=A0ABR4PMI8_9HELO
MSSKRQQARNERVLQDLVKTVPGNSVCADCQARNPGWASWSLGIFLCMRCAALHRKLGTHITKVKSLSMDSWSTDQVENMKRVGNTASNKVYNPKNTRPPIPIDADEADSAMERFIRQKYQEAANSYAPTPIRHNTGSTTSDDHPPPLPPKTGARFGFRSASSIFPLSSKASKARREAEATANIESRGRDQSPSSPRNKPSRVFGTSVGSEVPEDLDTKLSKLRDMGFRDEARNLAVLKGLGGNMEKTIETLVRLSGTIGGSTVTIGKSADTSDSTSRAKSPISLGAGLSINRAKDTMSPPRSARSATSSNPFDMLDAVPAQPQSTQSTGALGPQSQQNPYQAPATSNPFGIMPSQSQYGLNQAFQNMSVQSTQPLFPNHTGGFPAQQQTNLPYQQTMTPPVPSIPQQYHSPVIYENQGQQSGQQNYNPFMQQMQQHQQQQHQQPVPSLNTNFQSNPYATQLHSPAAQYYQSPLSQSPQVQAPSQAAYYDTGHQQPQQAAQSQANPFFQNSQPQQAPQQGYGYQQAQQSQQLQQPAPSQQQPQYDQFRQQTSPGVVQPTLRPDKRSILDLYNYPQLAPVPPQQPDQNSQPAQQQIFNPSAPAAMQPQQQANAFSNTLATHMAGSRNPFGGGMNGGATPTPMGSEALGGGVNPFPPKNVRHVSQESISVDSGGWMNGNGRHSPDAFAGLSARSMR